jgi:hypothetical protein
LIGPALDFRQWSGDARSGVFLSVIGHVGQYSRKPPGASCILGAFS